MNLSSVISKRWGFLVGLLAFVASVRSVDGIAADGQPLIAQTLQLGVPSIEFLPHKEPELSTIAAGSTTSGDESGEEKAETTEQDQLVRHIISPWAGDLDTMIKGRLIRALVVQSKTMYFVEKGRQHGIAFEMLTAFQDWINKRFPPKHKHLTTHVALVPVSQDRLRDLEKIKIRDLRRIFGCSFRCNIGRIAGYVTGVATEDTAKKTSQGAYFNIFQSPNDRPPGADGGHRRCGSDHYARTTEGSRLL